MLRLLILCSTGLALCAQSAPQGRTPPQKPERRWTPDAAWLATPHVLNRPRGGYVTKKGTAIAIAKAVLTEQYDDPKLVVRNGPFDAKRFGDVWVVYGYAPKSPEIVGGTYAVQISASTGTVINTTLDQ